MKNLPRSKTFWRIQEALALILVLGFAPFAIWLGYPLVGFIGLGLLLALHLAELKTALQVGKDRGISPGRVVLMNMLFGFTWWVPLREKIIEA